jgi:hypothetical protein
MWCIRLAVIRRRDADDLGAKIACMGNACEFRVTCDSDKTLLKRQCPALPECRDTCGLHEWFFAEKCSMHARPFIGDALMSTIYGNWLALCLQWDLRDEQQQPLHPRSTVLDVVVIGFAQRGSETLLRF